MAAKNRHLPYRKAVSALAIAALAIGLLVAVTSPASAAATRAFGAVFTANTTGDIVIRGNTLMSCPLGATSGGVTCASARAGANKADNDYTMGFVDADDDTATTSNSSTATVTVPDGATVLYAGLSWGATLTAGTGGVAAVTPANKGIVKFKVPGGTYANVTSTQTDGTTGDYQGYANVTSKVVAAGTGTYSVGDVQAGTGVDRYAGWSLAVAYRDPTQPTRNLVVYTGYATVNTTTSPVSISVSGFTTPASGSVVTRLGVGSYEGDRGATGDGLKLGQTSLSNSTNPVADIFNSTVTDLGVPITDRAPAYDNLLGVDIDRFDATGVLPNGTTSTSINLNTTGEYYYAGLLTFATDLYSPTLSTTKTATDLNGGNLSPGDTIGYSLAVSNTGGDASVSSVLSDAIPSGTSYIAGSLVVGGAAVTDAAGDDTGNVTSGTVTARLGTGATAAAGGRLNSGASSTVTFRVMVDSASTDGTAISNAATLGYSGLTTGVAYTGSSNTVVSTVVLPPTLTFDPPPAGRVGVDYSTQLTRTGGTGPFVWTVTSGALPPGLTLNASTGLLSGKPTAPGSTAFTIKVTDANGRSDTRDVTLVVTKGLSTLSLSTSASTTRFGVAVTLTSNVGPTSATGTVTFTDVPSSGPDSGQLVTLGTSPVASSSAALTLSLPAWGKNTVTATYSGDGTYASATSSTVEIEVAAYSGEVIVTELRGSGPAGSQDSYVEIFNAGAAVPLGGFAITSSSGATVTLPSTAGTLGTGRSFLVAGSAFSLGAVATPDLVGTLGSGGWALSAPDTAGTVTDAVGPSSGSHLGTGLAAISGSPAIEYAWVRAELTGQFQNTSSNAADFRLVSATGDLVGGIQSMLGSPSPTGTADAYQHNGALKSTLFDSTVSATARPNRVTKVGTPSTLVIRRKITNTSSTTISSAKIRVTSLSEANGDSTFPGTTTPPASRANLRIVNPTTTTSTVSSGGVPVTVQNLSVDAPLSGVPGGGLNSTLTVPLSGGLAPGASVSVAFSFEVDSRGSFWFGYDVDARSGVTPAGRVGSGKFAKQSTAGAEKAGRAKTKTVIDSGRLK